MCGMLQCALTFASGLKGSPSKSSPDVEAPLKHVENENIPSNLLGFSGHKSKLPQYKP